MAPINLHKKLSNVAASLRSKMSTSTDSSTTTTDSTTASSTTTDSISSSKRTGERTPSVKSNEETSSLASEILETVRHLVYLGFGGQSKPIGPVVEQVNHVYPEKGHKRRKTAGDSFLSFRDRQPLEEPIVIKPIKDFGFYYLRHPFGPLNSNPVSAEDLEAIGRARAAADAEIYGRVRAQPKKTEVEGVMFGDF